ncbi:hypothetical protein LEP1GSC193_2437 [Leptospira alstonii serovar Pingchang str. 80-412]|uniref:SH3 domain protein n=2 Tax=Leptospira alstonii TaxID=28452 RepID=M6D6E2_9LEPT|nr:hypothetical protein LEP1GSC194_2475 [Leptospira alstonii serovar Sichuan str. 79601]EQA81117.1 hypothetical protein LEP1GSC193_2437 [Leptospira alstonii serovar Pingchang str. 80-412]
MIKIPFNQEVYIDNFSDINIRINNINARWVKIRYKKFSGYVFGAYILLKDIDDSNRVFGSERLPFNLSTYDDSQYNHFTNIQKETLKTIFKSKAFNIIHDEYFKNNADRNYDYFKQHQEFIVIKVMPASFFSNRDLIYIVYDSVISRIRIVIFNGIDNSFLKLYDDLKVINCLSNDSCGFSPIYSMDFSVGGLLSESKDAIIKDPILFIKKHDLAKYTNIKQDSTFIPSAGCFALGVNSNNLLDFNSFCVNTSLYYNNWECLKLEKQRNRFLHYYGQAFAD